MNHTIQTLKVTQLTEQKIQEWLHKQLFFWGGEVYTHNPNHLPTHPATHHHHHTHLCTQIHPHPLFPNHIHLGKQQHISWKLSGSLWGGEIQGGLWDLIGIITEGFNVCFRVPYTRPWWMMWLPTSKRHFLMRVWMNRSCRNLNRSLSTWFL